MAMPTLLRDARGKAATWLLLFVLVAGAAFAIWYFVLREQASSSAARRLAQQVVPSRSDYVGGLDLEHLLTHADAKKVLADLGVDTSKLDQALAQAGIAPTDLGAVVFGAANESDGSTSVIVALDAKTDAKAIGGLLQVITAQLPKHVADTIDPSSLQTFEGEGGRGLFLLGNGPLLAEATALAKGGAATPRKTELALIEQAVADRALAWAAGPVPPNTFTGIKGTLATTTLGGTPSHFGAALGLKGDVVVTGAIHIPGGNAQTLSGALKTAQGMLSGQAPESIRPLLANIVFGGTGPVVTGTLKVDAQTLAALKKTL